MRALSSLLAMSLFTTGAIGCGSLESDRIEAICDCENCGDREFEEVSIIVQTDAEIAAIYECTEYLEEYWECQLQEYRCRDGRYEDDHEQCDNQYEDYLECLDDQSTRRGGPYR